MKQHTIQTAIAFAFLASSAVHAQNAVQWKVSDGGNGHWYAAVSSAGRSWQDCRQSFDSNGGHLATIGSAAENDFARSLTSNVTYWIGARRDGSACSASSGWSWVTGEAFAFTDWASSQPDCWQSGQLYLAVNNISYLPGWHDYDDTTSIPFAVCEWAADCNNDGIVDYGQCQDGTLPDYNGNNIPDCCERGEACVVGNYPVQWRLEDGGNGHWYAVLLEEPSISEWTERSSPPSAPGFHLAIVNNASENLFLIDFIQTVPSAPARLWIGLYRISGTTWVWNIDQGSSFTFWGGANCGAGPYPNYGYSGFLAAQFNNRSIDCGWNWDDFAPEITPDCWQLLEYDTDCNSDGVVDFGQIIQGQLIDSNTNGTPDICEGPTCHDIDLNLNGIIDGGDLGILLTFWGTVSPAFPRADINRDGLVNGADLEVVLSSWGPCPN